MKYSAVAPANIAFLKYWGKEDERLRLPSNSSFSMNLSSAVTKTTVEFTDAFKEDVVEFDGDAAGEKEVRRISEFLNIIRNISKQHLYAHVRTKNSFPKGTGIASSASGFAALTVAAAASIGLSLSEKELSILARLGSGSACRSIPDGFVVWEKGTSSDTSFAHSVAPHTFWDLRDIICIVDATMKKISTSDGHSTVTSSPLWIDRIAHRDEVSTSMMKAFYEKKFQEFGQSLEDECMNMHAVMQSQNPPLYYWNETTVRLMKTIALWRQNGIPVYYTIDAGPNVHVICEATNEQKIIRLLENFPGISRIVVNAPSQGAHLVNDHLF